MNSLVCRKDLSECGTIEEQVVHVNRCLDEQERINSLTVNQVIQRSNPKSIQSQQEKPSCPICFKPNCTLAHLRKCARDHNILPRDVVSVIEQFQQDFPVNGNGVQLKKVEKKPRVRKESGQKRAESKLRKTPAKKKKVATVQEINDDPEEPVVVTSSFFATNSNNNNNNPSITAKGGKIVVDKKPLTREDVLDRIDQLFKYTIVRNTLSVDDRVSQTSLPRIFVLASLTIKDEKEYIAKGFESVVERCRAGLEEITTQLQDKGDTGFFSEASSETKSSPSSSTLGFLQRLSRMQEDEGSHDLTIRTRDSVISCHSVIWAAQTITDNLDMEKAKEVDASDFSTEVVEAFVSYCYTGKMVVPSDCQTEMDTFIRKFGCTSIHDLDYNL